MSGPVDPAREGGSGPGTTSLLNRRRSLVPVLLGLFACYAIVATGLGSFRVVTELPPRLWSAHPYFVPEAFWLLHLWVPIVALSSFVVLLSPGMALLAALGGDRGLDRWLLKSFGLSLLVTTALAGVANSLFGSAADGRGFLIVVAVGTVIMLAAAAMRARSGRSIERPGASADAKTLMQVLALAVPLILLTAVLVPKVFWESFNGDGAHAFEVSRRVVAAGAPFLPADVGVLSAFPGITSMLFTYPNAWFIRLFGEIEASVRVPFLLYLGVLHAAICAAAGSGSKPPLPAISRWLLWPGLIVYTAVVAFSATYEPHHADLALPATQDTLFVLCFIGFVVFFTRRDHGWMILFLFLTVLSLPSWPLLVGAWIAAVLLLERPLPSRTLLVTAVCIVLGFGLPAAASRVLAWAGLPLPGGEYAAGSLLGELRYVQIGDLRRFLFVLIPSGILPALGLLAWRRQDEVARSLTVVTVICFAFFYLKAHTSLHYFIPAMLMPLAVFWRIVPTRGPGIGWSGAIGLAAAVALALSIPSSPAPQTHARLVGSAVADQRPGYRTFEPSFFRDLTIYNQLFPLPWDPRVPGESYGGSPLPWNYYAQRAPPPRSAANYFLMPRDGSAPPAARLVGT
ncbi:MAG: hypothetical protein JSV95_02090, partial [Gemmatimonadota bacterium]